MSRRCDLTNKGALKGHKVSHSNRKSRKFSEVNLQTKRFWSERQRRYVRLRVATSTIRTIDLYGYDRYVESVKHGSR